MASPLRPRDRQESGIAAAGRLAPRGTPYGASLSFATTTHLWPLSDPPSRKPPQRITKPHWGPPGQFRAAPLPLQCWIPPIRAPGQDSHLRSQHPYPAHRPRPTGSASATTVAPVQAQRYRHPGWDTFQPAQVVHFSTGLDTRCPRSDGATWPDHRTPLRDAEVLLPQGAELFRAEIHSSAGLGTLAGPLPQAQG
jgi:hypothetical protein